MSWLARHEASIAPLLAICMAMYDTAAWQAWHCWQYTQNLSKGSQMDMQHIGSTGQHCSESIQTFQLEIWQIVIIVRNVNVS